MVYLSRYENRTNQSTLLLWGELTFRFDCPWAWVVCLQYNNKLSRYCCMSCDGATFHVTIMLTGCARRWMLDNNDDDDNDDDNRTNDFPLSCLCVCRSNEISESAQIKRVRPRWMRISSFVCGGTTIRARWSACLTRCWRKAPWWIVRWRRKDNSSKHTKLYYQPAVPTLR